MEGRINTSYIRMNENGRHIVFDKEGMQIGHWSESEGAEQYKGTPACALLPGIGGADITDGAAVITTSFRTGRMAQEAGAGAVYILSGESRRALGDGLKVLRERYKSIIIMDRPDSNGVIKEESLIMQRLGGDVEVRTPGQVFRKNAAQGLTKELIRDGMKSAEAPLSPRIESFYGLKRSDRYDVEKIKTPWGSVNHHLYGGIPRGQFTLFCSKSGNGKSTMILQIAGCALEQGHRVGIYSGESSKGEIADTLSRQIAGKRHMEVFERGGRKCYYVGEAEYDDIIENVVAPNMKYVAESFGSRTPWTDFKKDVLDLIAHAGMDVIVIDNVMTAADLVMTENRCSEFEAQGLVAKWMEHVATQYQVWMLTVSHLRKVTARGAANTNDNVAGASALVNAAGVVLYYDKITDKPEDTKRILKITKNRIYGELCFDGISVDFDRPTQRTFEADSPKGADYKSAWEKRYDEGVWEITLPDELTFEECEKEEKEILSQVLPGVDVRIRFVYPSEFRTVTPKTYSLASAVEITRERKREGRRIYFRDER